MGVPTPHILPVRAVELRGTPVGELVVVRRVELAPLAVVRNEVAPEAEDARKLAQKVDISIRLADRRPLGLVPPADRDLLVHDADRVKEVHPGGLPARILHLHHVVLQTAGGQRQIRDPFSVVESRDNRFYLAFFLFCKCHIYLN